MLAFFTAKMRIGHFECLEKNLAQLSADTGEFSVHE